MAAAALWRGREAEQSMAKRSGMSDRPLSKGVLRDAFKAIEAEPAPVRLVDHVDKLTAPKPRPDGRS